MKFCPISLEPIENHQTYSPQSLRLLSARLTTLSPLQFTSSELRREAMNRATKMSIQGMQPKLSAQLELSKETFQIVDIKGRYILKPPHEYWPELPANEALSMTLAQTIGLSIPLHGLVFNTTGEFIYFVKRFDRQSRDRKIAVEDFAQLSQETRDTKYKSSAEKISKIIDTYCTFPVREKEKLLKVLIFSYLIGNEDMHLKNFSLIRNEDIIEFSPFYDLINTTIALIDPQEESALPLNGKKNKLQKEDFIDYFGNHVLKLSSQSIKNILSTIYDQLDLWLDYIHRSYLSSTMRLRYEQLLRDRWKSFWNIQ